MFQVWGLDGSQKLRIFHEDAEVESQTSLIGIIFVEIWLYIKTCPRHKIKKANGLSKRSDWKVGVDRNNDNQTLIKNNWICSLGEVVREKKTNCKNKRKRKEKKKEKSLEEKDKTSSKVNLEQSK